MKLNELHLQNFQGTRDLTLRPRGRNISIYGDNQTGKTTIANAISWLLFDKDSKGNSKFAIKTIANGEELHNLEHSVTAEFELESGETVSFSKVYKEVWKTTRGVKNRPEFSGHTTDHYVNTVPVSEGEYKARVSSICDEQSFRLLTDPLYFSKKLDWKKRREMLFEFFGNCPDQEILDADPEKYANLLEALGTRTIDELQRICAETQKRLNKTLEEIPARIDELNLSLTASPAPAVEISTKAIEAEIEKLLERRANVTPDEALADLRTRINAKRLELDDLNTKLSAEQNEEKTRVGRELSSLRMEASKIESEINERKMKAESLERNRKRIEEEIQKARDQREALLAQSFDDSKLICPSCKRPIEEGEAEKIKADFNTAKATALEGNTTAGKMLVATKKSITAEIEALNAEIAVRESELLSVNMKFSEKNREYKDAVTREVPPSAARAQLVAELEKLESEFLGTKSKSNPEIEGLVQLITDAKSKLAEIQAANARFHAAKLTEQRIAQLTQEETDFLAQREKNLAILDQINVFHVEKRTLLSDAINRHFDLVEFKLFDVQINGGIAECCEVTVKGVPYGSINTGSEINAGLEIIDVISKLKSFAPFIVIDNAESITRLRETRGQQIRLIVSEHDKSLRIENQPEPELALL